MGALMACGASSFPCGIHVEMGDPTGRGFHEEDYPVRGKTCRSGERRIVGSKGMGIPSWHMGRTNAVWMTEYEKMRTDPLCPLPSFGRWILDGWYETITCRSYLASQVTSAKSRRSGSGDSPNRSATTFNTRSKILSAFSIDDRENIFHCPTKRRLKPTTSSLSSIGRLIPPNHNRMCCGRAHL